MHIHDISQGRIFMFDGPDGVGKTEQIAKLAGVLTDEGYTVHTTRVHGGTPFGEKLREVSLSDTPRTPQTELYLFRTMHMELAHDLHERKAKGEICLVDRSPAAMWAYQVRAGGLDENFAKPLITDSFTLFSADAVYIYLASLHQLQERIQHRGDTKGDYFANQADAYHEWTIIGYTEAVTLFGAHSIDATGSSEEVHTATLALLRPLLPKHEQ